jgi:hypothetical protein
MYSPIHTFERESGSLRCCPPPLSVSQSAALCTNDMLMAILLWSEGRELRVVYTTLSSPSWLIRNRLRTIRMITVPPDSFGSATWSTVLVEDDFYDSDPSAPDRVSFDNHVAVRDLLTDIFLMCV